MMITKIHKKTFECNLWKCKNRFTKSKPVPRTLERFNM